MIACSLFFSWDFNYIAHLCFHVNSSNQCFLCISDKEENFQSDHAALLSILRNEGVSATGLRSANSLSKPYNFLVSCFFIIVIYFLLLQCRWSLHFH